MTINITMNCICSIASSVQIIYIFHPIILISLILLLMKANTLFNFVQLSWSLFDISIHKKATISLGFALFVIKNNFDDVEWKSLSCVQSTVPHHYIFPTRVFFVAGITDVLTSSPQVSSTSSSWSFISISTCLSSLII